MLGATTGGVDNASRDYLFKLFVTQIFIFANLMDGATLLQLDRHGAGMKNCKWTTLRLCIGVDVPPVHAVFQSRNNVIV